MKLYSQDNLSSRFVLARAKHVLPIPIILFLIGLIITGCNFIRIEWINASTPAPAAGGIIFVTVTPEPEVVLNEGERFRPVPTPNFNSPDYFAQANELGKIMVLEYHKIGYSEQRFQRTPENFRADLQRLYQHGYYPVNFIDVIRGLPNVPPGKKPVVLTFDDSDISQFRVLDDNTIDADSAIGIILNFHDQHPAEWPTRATFFILGNDVANYGSVFGQPKWAKAKVQLLVELGMEVGSHTVNHVDLSVATKERIYWELAMSQHVIEIMVPGYKVESLSVPYGGFPYSLEFLKSGQWGNYDYSYAGNAAAWGGASVSPFDATFDPYRVPRIEATATALNHWLTHFEQNPYEYYVSDGDPSQLTFPQPEAALEEPGN